MGVFLSLNVVSCEAITLSGLLAVKLCASIKKLENMDDPDPKVTLSFFGSGWPGKWFDLIWILASPFQIFPRLMVRPVLVRETMSIQTVSLALGS